MTQRSIPNTIFFWCVVNRNRIVQFFYLLYVLLTLMLSAGIWSILTGDSTRRLFRGVAGEFGELAILFFILSSLPGIFRRFGVSHKFVNILMMFRRYTGITSFLCALLHSFFEKILPVLAGTQSFFPLEANILFGVVSVMLLFILFITSNDWSVTKFGEWWIALHNLTYIIVWFIAVHVALVTRNVWSILIILTAIFQVASHVRQRQRKE